MSSYLDAMHNSWKFSGRLGRREFWIFQLVLVLIISLISALELPIAAMPAVQKLTFGVPVLTLVVVLVHLPASISVLVRRLHDFDTSGWWVLASFLPLAVLIIGCIRSSNSENRYGFRPGWTMSPHEQLMQILDQLEQVGEAHRAGTISHAEFVEAKRYFLAA